MNDQERQEYDKKFWRKVTIQVMFMLGIYLFALSLLLINKVFQFIN